MTDARDQMREAFEAWALTEYLSIDRYGPTYRHDAADWAWMGWQAQAAYAARQPGKTPGAAMSAEAVKLIRAKLGSVQSRLGSFCLGSWESSLCNEITAVLNLLPETAAGLDRREE